MIKNKHAKKRLAVSLYLLKEDWDFIYISDIRFPTIC